MRICLDNATPRRGYVFIKLPLFSSAGAQHIAVPHLGAAGRGGSVQQRGGGGPELAQWKDADLTVLQYQATCAGGEREAVHQSAAHG